MTIDFHTHIFPENIAAKVVETLRLQTKGKLSPAGDGTMQQLMQQLITTGIEKAVLCPVATKPDQFKSILNFSLDITKGTAGAHVQQMLIPFTSVHPANPDCFKQLEKTAKSGIKGIKLHPFYQNFSLGSAHTIDFMRCCRDLGLIVICHCGQDIGFPDELICTPAQILKIHEKTDGVKFIAAHLGGWHMWKDVCKELMGEPIYLDTSVLEADLHSEEVQEILTKHPAEKLLLGSDWPWCSLSKAKGLIQELNICAEDKALIMGGNAESLLGRG